MAQWTFASWDAKSSTATISSQMAGSSLPVSFPVAVPSESFQNSNGFFTYLGQQATALEKQINSFDPSSLVGQSFPAV